MHSVTRLALTWVSPNSPDNLPCKSTLPIIWIYILIYFRLYDTVTTVPLSVCYGALNLLVLADTSNFVPYV